MPNIAVSNTVVYRDDMGKFLAAVNKGVTAAVRETVEDGAKMSRRLAPSGSKHDPRTIKLKDSIEWYMTGATSGVWVATARHALPIEYGARPHPIKGKPDLLFWWDKEGRYFTPSHRVDEVSHPGNAAQPYLRPAYEATMPKLLNALDKHIPG